MRRRGIVPMLVAALAAPAIAGAQVHTVHVELGAPGPLDVLNPTVGPNVPLYDNLGDHHYEISTSVPRAQAYFDQGLRLYYAFNHQEGIRSFREAQRLDPQCAMCWWGEALAWGPNINLAMDSASAVAAYEAIRGAIGRVATASDREVAMINALATRYAEVPPSDRASLDEAYARAMGQIAHDYPGDHEIQVLHAESLMTLRPWDYWTESGAPQPGISDALMALEGVIDENDEHPGACHFFIHAVEKLYPERAVPCAERLANLMPGAGHLVHMPGHIYIRVGRYLDAVRANRHAVHADETYISDQNPAMGMYTAGYYPHNYDFMAFAAMMIGSRDESVASAKKVASLIPEEMFGAPGMDFLQHWSMRPLQMLVRFGAWDEILAIEAPPADRAHSRAIWYYAQGRALTATGETRKAEAKLESLRGLLASGRLNGLRMEFNQSVDILPIAEAVLAGRIAAAKGDGERAAASMYRAVEREDGLLYGEPPEWSVPTRQELGEVLLAVGQAEAAADAFRADLERFPGNVWSLAGLSDALRTIGDDAAARETERKLQEILSAAGVAPEVIGR